MNFAKVRSSLKKRDSYVNKCVISRSTRTCTIACILYVSQTAFTAEDMHTGPSFNTGSENTIQVSKFKRIGFEKKWRI